jgi:predicted naringenin-chalcone synthase
VHYYSFNKASSLGNSMTNFSCILGLGTAVPQFKHSQTAIAESLVRSLKLSSEQAKKLFHIFKQSDISYRYSVLPDFSEEFIEPVLFNDSLTIAPPCTKQRNTVYKKEASVLAHAAALKSIQNWGGNSQEITHVISVTCTGLSAPGIESSLIDLLHLNRTVRTLGINFMGCFGAFKALAVAHAIANENPKNRVLVVCTELCTLHLQATCTIENFVSNAIFADGAAAVIVGKIAEKKENILWRIKDFSSFTLENTQEEMSWNIGNYGFEMRLTAKIPLKIFEHIQNFVNQLYDSTGTCNWAIHPGGKAILNAVKDAFSLDESHLKASRDVLTEYGNMSSATFLFVLEKLLKQEITKAPTIGLGFGPGLCIEGILLEKGCDTI